MTYSLYVFHPNDILKKYEVVISDTSIPLVDVLASPEFEWYPGLCVSAIDDQNNMIYSGIFSEDACIDVSRESLAKIYPFGHSNLFGFWRRSPNISMAGFVERLAPKERLQSLSAYFVDKVSNHLLSRDLNFFDDIKTFNEEKFDRKINNIIRRRDARYRTYEIEYHANTVLLLAANIMRGKYPYLISVCSSFVKYMAAFDDTSEATEESALADLFREKVPFYEIAIGVINAMK